MSSDKKYIVCWRLFADRPTEKIYVDTREEAEQQVKEASLQGVRAWIAPNPEAIDAV